MAENAGVNRVRHGRISKLKAKGHEIVTSASTKVKQCMKSAIKTISSKIWNPQHLEQHLEVASGDSKLFTVGDENYVVVGKKAVLKVGVYKVTIYGLELFPSIKVVHRADGRLRVEVEITQEDKNNFGNVHVSSDQSLLSNVRLDIFEFGPEKKIVIKSLSSVVPNAVRIIGPVAGFVVIFGDAGPNKTVAPDSSVPLDSDDEEEHMVIEMDDDDQGNDGNGTEQSPEDRADAQVPSGSGAHQQGNEGGERMGNGIGDIS